MLIDIIRTIYYERQRHNTCLLPISSTFEGETCVERRPAVLSSNIAFLYICVSLADFVRIIRIVAGLQLDAFLLRFFSKYSINCI